MLDIFKASLQKWGRIHSLTSDSSSKAIDENIEDSLYPLEFLEFGKNIADIGSGAGYPALPLASKLTESHFTLFEPLGKKASFLLNTSIEMGLKNVTVLQKRVEEHSGKFDMIISRAVGDIDTILDISSSISTPSTLYLLYSGEIKVGKYKEIVSTKRRKKRVYCYFKKSELTHT
ncbi:MAG: 16S rRNA (guanine(527)-N(7))-methyltransferase RsmG [Campylobacterales bacterium]